MAHKQESLYALKLFNSSYRLGNIINNDFNIVVLNDKYAEKGLLKDTIEFLKEVLFNPNVEDNKFDEESFKVIYNDMLSIIETFKENPRRYASLRTLELTDNTKPFSYNLKGYLEDLKKITRENLYEYYKKFINNKVDIYIIGNIDFKETEKLFRDNYNFECKTKEFKNPIVSWNKNKKQEFIEKDNTNQSKLSISCYIDGLTEFERKYVLNIYNSILGGSPDSKFFKNIREKHSLCYYASTGVYKLDNLLFISSGISKDNYKKVLELIEKEMNDIKKGIFTEEDISKAKKGYLKGLEEIEDNPNQIIASYYAEYRLNIDPLEKRKTEIMKVTKEDIINLSKKISIDTIFLLGGDRK
jgi:predicted Zn-dependent peptidase